MLDLINAYEFSRMQIHQRICELNQILKSSALRTKEREAIIARRDMLIKERSELLEDILLMKDHIRKEECLHAQTCLRIRS